MTIELRAGRCFCDALAGRKCKYCITPREINADAKRIRAKIAMPQIPFHAKGESENV